MIPAGQKFAPLAANTDTLTVGDLRQFLESFSSDAVIRFEGRANEQKLHVWEMYYDAVDSPVITFSEVR